VKIKNSPVKIKNWCLLFAVQLLLGCSHTSIHRSDYFAAPTTKQNGMMAHQHIVIKALESESRLEAVLEFNEQEMTAIFLNEFGQRTATLKLGLDAALTVRKEALIPQSLSPKHSMNAIQHIFWPTSSLIHLDGWKIVENESKRSIFIEGVLVADVEYGTRCPWSGNSRYVNYRYKYSLTVNSSVLNPPQEIEQNAANCFI